MREKFGASAQGILYFDSMVRASVTFLSAYPGDADVLDAVSVFLFKIASSRRTRPYLHTLPSWNELLRAHHCFFNGLPPPSNVCSLESISPTCRKTIMSALLLAGAIDGFEDAERVRGAYIAAVIEPVNSFKDKLLSLENFASSPASHSHLVAHLVHVLSGVAGVSDTHLRNDVANFLISYFPLMLQLFALFHDDFIVSLDVLHFFRSFAHHHLILLTKNQQSLFR